MKPEFKISETNISRDATVGNIVKTEEKELLPLYRELSKASYFDTGLLPIQGEGLLSIRQAGDRLQFVHQHAPGINFIIWGKGQGDPNAKEYHLAQPYRIVIGDHVDGEIRGARHFYSPYPIVSIDQPLYHCNVPNLNCKGYSGTSVGWICIYHNQPKYEGLPLSARIAKTLERASGHEAYNDQNMLGTDGPRFYEEHYGKKKELSYLWNATAWQEKTDAEGFQWTLNPELWIPIKVAGIDDQDKHDVKGVPLTLEMAMLGNYKAYYPMRTADEKEMSLMNRIRRGDLDNPTGQDIYSLVNTAFAKSNKEDLQDKLLVQQGIPGVTGLLTTEKIETVKKQWKAEAPVFQANGNVAPPVPVPAVFDPTIGECVHCFTDIEEDDDYYFDTNDNYICEKCYNEHYGKTTCCEQIILLGEQFFVAEKNAYYCYSCHTKDVCPGCGETFIDNPYALFGTGCIDCQTPHYCDYCNGKFTEDQIQNVNANEALTIGALTAKTYTLCIGCFQASMICACGLLKPDTDCTQLPATGEVLCAPCVKFTPNNEPVYVSVHGNKK